MSSLYFVNSEISVPTFKHAAQTVGCVIPNSVLAYKVDQEDASALTVDIINQIFYPTRADMEVYALAPGDAVIFETPAFTISQEIATGISIYIANIGSAVGGNVKVTIYTPLIND